MASRGNLTEKSHSCLILTRTIELPFGITFHCKIDLHVASLICVWLLCRVVLIFLTIASRAAIKEASMLLQ